MKKGKSYKIGFVQTELVAKRWQPAKVRSIWSWTIVFFRRFAPKHRKIKLLDKARKAKVHLYWGRKWMNSLKFRPTPVVGQSVVDKTSRFQSKTIFLNLNHGLISACCLISSLLPLVWRPPGGVQRCPSPCWGCWGGTRRWRRSHWRRSTANLFDVSVPVFVQA